MAILSDSTTSLTNDTKTGTALKYALTLKKYLNYMNENSLFLM